MIVTTLEDAARQLPATPAFAAARRFLADPKSWALPPGRVEIDGDRVFALVQAYETAPAPEPLFEAHRRYADIQYIVEGEERIDWAPVGQMIAEKPYDPGKDAAHGRVPAGASTSVKLFAGYLGVFFPADAHAPKQALGSPRAVRKIVVKVAV